MRPIILTLTPFLFFWGCVNKQTSSEKETKRSVTDSVVYNKIEIYCYCFQLSAHEQMSTTYSISCGDDIDNFSLKNVISPKHYFDSVTDSKKINSFVNFVFHSYNKTEPAEKYPLARFVMLFKKNNDKADTVILNYDQSLNINGKTLYTYPFYVMDTVRSIINKYKIECDLFSHQKNSNR